MFFNIVIYASSTTEVRSNPNVMFLLYFQFQTFTVVEVDFFFLYLCPITVEILCRSFLLEIEAEVIADSAVYWEHPVGLLVSCCYTRSRDLPLQRLGGIPDLIGGTQCLQISFINIEM